MSANLTTTRHPGSPLVYEVSCQGEHGVFFIEPFLRTSAHEEPPTLGIRLTANTDFGAVGHTWGNLGPYEMDRWPEMLAGMNKDYLLGKLFVGRDLVFDATKTLSNMLSGLDPDEPIEAAVMEAIESVQAGFLPDNEYELAQAIEQEMLTNDTYVVDEDTVSSVCDLIQTHRAAKTADQAEGFWTYLWPAVMEQVGAKDMFENTLRAQARLEPQLQSKHKASTNARPRP